MHGFLSYIFFLFFGVFNSGAVDLGAVHRGFELLASHLPYRGQQSIRPTSYPDPYIAQLLPLDPPEMTTSVGKLIKSS